MIAYDLECGSGHTFEGWFQDHKAFAEQMRKRLIACPVCNDTSVAVVPSTFSIKSCAPEPQVPETSIRDRDKLEGQRLSEFLEQHFEDVGTRFAAEALKIHYGVSEKRSIKGTSSKSEEEMLEQEGVKFFKIPVPRLDS
ncbi:MAG: DUF1178 family protein [Thermodesulfobacteriota bacterium]|nr:DUF1178 family protein [Thermodesulfobacteriota bacterium]